MYMTPGTSGYMSDPRDPASRPDMAKEEFGIPAKKKKFQGLGDVVHAVMKVTGIEKIVKKASKGKDCGCAKRQAALNKAVPFTKGGIE